MNQIVRRVFDEHLKTVFASKPDILRFLLNHERKNLCLERLAKEIRMAELSQKVGGSAFNISKLRACIETTANIFALAALEAKKKELLSLMELKRLEDEAAKVSEAQNVLREIGGDP